MKWLSLSISLLCVSLSALAERAADEDALIILTPRVVFADDNNYRSVHVRNIAETTGYYEVYLEPARHLSEVQQATKVNDNYVPANLLEQMANVVPNLLVIAPDEEAIIELVMTKPAGLPAGEYHSRLIFRAMPSPEEAAEAELAEKEQVAAELVAAEQGIQLPDSPVLVRVQLPEYGVPVVMREGVTQAVAQLSAPELLEDEHGFWLSLTLNRQGERSLFGDFKVLGDGPGVNAPDVLMIKKYVSLDIPETSKTVAMRFPDSADLMLYRELKIQFQERARYGGEQKVELVLPLE